MDLKLALALLLGKTISFLTRISGSGGTAAPGLYALKVDPQLVHKLCKKIRYGSIVISGTNGKTTTSRLTAEILSTKFEIIHNRQGSNLLRGIASTLIRKSNFLGKVRADLAIWEVDEATLQDAVTQTSPIAVALLNLFRDQLDRYGEVDSVRLKWQKALRSLPKNTRFLINADDPLVYFVASYLRGKITYFGVNDTKINLPQIAHIADVRHCPQCSAVLIYQTQFSAHMGHYACSNCRFIRPSPQVFASNLIFKPNFSINMKLTVRDQLPLSKKNHLLEETVDSPLPGLYNVYNILAATSISGAFGVELESVKAKLQDFSAVFGRFQKINIKEKSIIIFLIKNPAGANEVLRTISYSDKFVNILAILNDKIADGRDVSWIWDTNWEMLKPKIKSVTVSGIRAWDLATRLKYADFKIDRTLVNENINYSVINSVKNMDTYDTLIILPTYTALLSVQKSLNKLGASAKWHED